MEYTKVGTNTNINKMRKIILGSYCDIYLLFCNNYYKSITVILYANYWRKCSNSTTTITIVNNKGSFNQ